MKIDITKKEYRTLLDVLSIADWIIHAYHEGPGDKPETKKYRDLEQKFLVMAKDFGYENLIEYADDLKKYFPTREFDETSKFHGYIDEYSDESFWGDLSDRLASRDLIRKEGEEKLEKMDRDERFKKLCEIEDKYSEEFYTSGLDNVRVLSLKNAEI